MSIAIPINFCTQCGSSVSYRKPDGDDVDRHVCDDCGFVHYQNPKVVNGTIITADDKILLCKRAIEPRHGYWTLPAGFMENGETTYQGAERETWEEARARVVIKDLFLTANLPHINQIYMLFRAHLVDAAFEPGPESLDVALFDEAEIPWDEIAFPVISTALELYFKSRRSGDWTPRMVDIYRNQDQALVINECFNR